MSGHSHAKTVAATKNANNAKKGKIFSKMGRVITIAVKEKGSDASVNPTLKGLIEKAKEFNMPKENIERAIKKGTGELVGENLEEVSFEGFGPGGIALIIEGITDNKNRTLGEVKTILGKFEGKLAGEGAVKWMFEKKGVIIVSTQGKSTGDLELLAIDCDAQDFLFKNDFLYIYTRPENFEDIKNILREKSIAIESSDIELVANKEISLDAKNKEKAEKLFDALNENDAVQNIYSNLGN